MPWVKGLRYHVILGLGFILAQILLSEIRFVSCLHNSVICQNMEECLDKQEVVAGVVRVDLVYHGKKDGCRNMHFSTNLVK